MLGPPGAQQSIRSAAQQLRIAVPVYTRDMGEPARALQALKLLPLRYAKLADSVESASAQYKQMVFARGPLKFSLILTLSLVSLVAMGWTWRMLGKRYGGLAVPIWFHAGGDVGVMLGVWWLIR